MIFFLTGAVSSVVFCLFVCLMFIVRFGGVGWGGGGGSVVFLNLFLSQRKNLILSLSLKANVVIFKLASRKRQKLETAQRQKNKAKK